MYIHVKVSETRIKMIIYFFLLKKYYKKEKKNLLQKWERDLYILRSSLYNYIYILCKMLIYDYQLGLDENICCFVLCKIWIWMEFCLGVRETGPRETTCSKKMKNVQWEGKMVGATVQHQSEQKVTWETKREKY